MSPGWLRRRLVSTGGLGAELATVTRRVGAPPEAVWSVLADGWVYATWVVGTSRVREVDAVWPQERARIHHSFGLWPLLIDDTSQVLRADPPHELLLKARGWPLGEAHVLLRLEPDGPSGCRVSIIEDAVAGPGRLAPKRLRQALIAPRNAESLRRLGFLAEGRHRKSGTDR